MQYDAAKPFFLLLLSSLVGAAHGLAGARHCGRAGGGTSGGGYPPHKWVNRSSETTPTMCAAMSSSPIIGVPILAHAGGSSLPDTSGSSEAEGPPPLQGNEGRVLVRPYTQEPCTCSRDAGVTWVVTRGGSSGGRTCSCFVIKESQSQSRGSFLSPLQGCYSSYSPI